MSLILGLRSTFNDSDAFCEATQGFDVEFIQLDSGNLEASLEVSLASNCVVQRVSLNRRFFQRGEGPGDMFCFGVPDVRTLRNWCGKKLEKPALLNFSSQDGYESVSEENFSAYTFALPEKFLQEHIDLLGYDVSVEDIQKLADWRALSQQEYDQLGNIGSHFIRQGTPREQESHIVEELESMLAHIILNKTLGSHLKEERLASAVKTKIIRRSLELIHSQSEGVSIKDLHQYAETSWRTLNRTFKEHFGVNPKRYIVAARLHAVRKELMAPPDSSVTEIASKWGFNHLGRFSAYYSSMYGELPSQTSRKQFNQKTKR